MAESTSQKPNEAEETIQDPLRVSQLDATELDVELYDVLFDKFDNIFKYFQPKILLRYKPEINASLRLLIWKYTVGANEASIGQELLELRYKNDRALLGDQWMSRTQKILHAVFSVGGPWFEDRTDDLQAATENWPHSDKIWLVVDYFTKFWKVAALVNFLVFLTRGKYQFLLERILGIRAVFPAAQGVRQIAFEYMDRELLWHGFAEFLFFILPLINFRRIKNFLVRKLLTSTPKSSTGTDRTEEDFSECPICEEIPYNPHEIGCRHVFCYYCISSHHLADPSYTCPLCGQAVGDASSIVQARANSSDSSSTKSTTSVQNEEDDDKSQRI